MFLQIVSVDCILHSGSSLKLLIVFYTVDQVCKCWLYIAQWFKFASVDCVLHGGSSLYLYFLTVFCTVVQVCICIF